MKISVLLHTSEFRGDHAADVAEAHDVRPGETVEELVARLIPAKPRSSYHALGYDRIELRRVQETHSEYSERNPK